MEGTDEGEKEAIREGYINIKDNPIPPAKHHITKFHCLGLPFSWVKYKKPVLAARLYFSIKNALSDDIDVFPSYNFGSTFASEVFLSTSTNKFYHFCAVPDLAYNNYSRKCNVSK